MPAQRRKYQPRNPHKYIGDLGNIVARSSWEVRYMKWLDNESSVLRWGSEPFAIAYRSPVDSRQHRYFPDFFVEFRDRENIIKRWVVEIKPHKQTSPPPTGSKQTRRFLREALTYAINYRKWEAAEKYCTEHGYRFVILTERELGI